MKEGQELSLCGSGSCCPTLKRVGDSIMIKDDDGDIVTLPQSSWNALIMMVQVGNLTKI